ncbi:MULTISPECIES: hypothetical protein [unclassified Pseudomonas]|uniref:hypothetical protein n=1 Tax=unclassified Pseudomonas TaxID=196821 RepID=UPI0011AF853A|nr:MULTISPECIES: hypothetical protein [unclassified Pseudomonas]
MSASNKRIVLTTVFIGMAFGCSEFGLIYGVHRQTDPQELHYWWSLGGNQYEKRIEVFCVVNRLVCFCLFFMKKTKNVMQR